MKLGRWGPRPSQRRQLGMAGWVAMQGRKRREGLERVIRISDLEREEK